MRFCLEIPSWIICRIRRALCGAPEWVEDKGKCFLSRATVREESRVSSLTSGTLSGLRGRRLDLEDMISGVAEFGTTGRRPLNIREGPPGIQKRPQRVNPSFLILFGPIRVSRYLACRKHLTPVKTRAHSNQMGTQHDGRRSKQIGTMAATFGGMATIG